MCSGAVLESDPGYRPESSLNRTCGSDGRWREEVLCCVVVIQLSGTKGCVCVCVCVHPSKPLSVTVLLVFQFLFSFSA